MSAAKVRVRGSSPAKLWRARRFTADRNVDQGCASCAAMIAEGARIHSGSRLTLALGAGGNRNLQSRNAPLHQQAVESYQRQQDAVCANNDGGTEHGHEPTR